jgi:hypothetical protein
MLTYVLDISSINFRMWQNLNIEFLILRNYVFSYFFSADKTEKNNFPLVKGFFWTKKKFAFLVYLKRIKKKS